MLTGWSAALVAGVPVSAFISQFVGWRASYLLLAALLAAASAGFLRLQDPAADRAPSRFQADGMSLLPALRSPGVPVLLSICFAFMTAFYGVYAYIGDHLRSTLGVSSGTASLVILAYGLGFGLAGFGDRVVDRLGPTRLFAGVLGGLVLVYGAMVPASGSLAAMTVLAALWGCANHFGLNMLVLLLGQADAERRGAVLALNGAASYAGTLAGAGLFGPVYERGGFGTVAVLAAACMVGASVMAATGRVRQPSTSPAARAAQNA